ncbi:MAG TPA: crossover junction endodeoxyribonuclease RuvC [Verrucomicrobiae bacterium]|nr:crossover junction endodeoxyribonuclease RuvC [Verrucomicrobiae bacterium]
MAITGKQFEEVQKRVSGGARKPAPALPALAARNNLDTVLGIDPSLRGTGYGIIRLAKPAPTLIAQGTIACPAGWERSRCLAHIAQSLRAVVKQHQPQACAIEGLFYAQNLQTALIMGEARGAALAVVAEAGVAIYEIAARKVKQAIVGYGAAQKTAVARMVQRMLQLPVPPAPDAADALALALAFAHESRRPWLSAPKKV